MRPVLLFAIAFDVLTLCLVSLLLWQGVIPRELGAGLLGAVIGVRARWSDHDPRGGPPSSGGHADLLGRVPEVGGVPRVHHLAREVLEESAVGQLFGWSRIGATQ